MDGSLKITSPAFSDGGEMPKRHTGFGEDVSPAFHIEGLSPRTVTVAIIMDDLDVPGVRAYNHWTIWNLPPQAEIPESIPYGTETLGGASQGTGYGKNRYRGPKQPFFVRNRHRYQFTFYALDARVDLPPSGGKAALLQAMEGHILQTGGLLGTYQR